MLELFLGTRIALSFISHDAFLIQRNSILFNIFTHLYNSQDIILPYYVFLVYFMIQKLDWGPKASTVSRRDFFRKHFNSISVKIYYA